MNNETYTPHYYYLDQLYISEIVIDETENISIFGYLYDEVKTDLVRWDVFANFDQMTDMLLQADDEGDKIIHILSETLSKEYDIPTIIEVENLFGKPLHLNSHILKVYIPHEKNDSGDWQPMDERCLYIDQLKTKEAFQSLEPKKEIAVIKNDEIIGDLLDAALYNLHKNDRDEPAKYLENHLAILDSAYEHYKILLKGFSEKKARKIAGLKNELLFRIAYYNNKLKK